jgi:hypothetical protein
MCQLPANATSNYFERIAWYGGRDASQKQKSRIPVLSDNLEFLSNNLMDARQALFGTIYSADGKLWASGQQKAGTPRIPERNAISHARR